MINISLTTLLTTASIGGGALVDAINLHYLVKEDKSTHSSDSNSSSKKKSWLGTDLRNLNGSLHHFDFANLDPTTADININLNNSWHLYNDIYDEIGQKLDYLFSQFKLNICFSDNMLVNQLGEKFLILNHDCVFSDSKEDQKTGEHWKVTDQYWKAPTKQDIPEDHYYCYNLQLVNLYNNTSLTFACKICNFVTNKVYSSYFKNNHSSYKWDNGCILSNIHALVGMTDYSDFLHLGLKPDYILTSENKLHCFYRSGVTFNFFNTDLLDSVLMKKVNEGVNQILILNHNYTLTKKVGCYQFLVTFHDYPSHYYGYQYSKTITLNVRIIPDYDFSQGLNAVTLNYISWDGNNYSPILHSDDYWAVDIYLDGKTIRWFYKLLFNSPSIKKSYLSIIDEKKINFKNLCSFDDLNLKDSVNYFQDNQLYQFLNNTMTHYDDGQYSHLEALKHIISFYLNKNNNSGHLHFILKKDYEIKGWNILNSGEVNIEHFYDKIVQPDQWK